MSENPPKKLSTDSYKGVRDFYPADMAIQSHIFDTWSKVAESFGFLRYDASVLEPAELYKTKSSEEIFNEQTYTFTDRGDREVTLRPEMTPTVARMVAARHKELQFPLRWYSIPNLFRYERQQRGRLREHWQLNCDIFGTTDINADVEVIALGHAIFLAFGAKEEDFKILLNDRASLNKHLEKSGVVTTSGIRNVTSVIDKKSKMSEENFNKALAESAGPDFRLPDTEPVEVTEILNSLKKLGIANASYDPSTVRGFEYYTGTVFEFFDTHEDNNRSLLGGGRYDNLTELFGGEAIPGVGFGFGDVTIQNFLETHELLSALHTEPQVMLTTTSASLVGEAEKIAQTLREKNIKVAVNLAEKKLGDQVSAAAKSGIPYVITVGEDEIKSDAFTLRKLEDGSEITGSLEKLAKTILE